MTTKKQLINEIETTAKNLVGTKFKYNPLAGCINYKLWDKQTLQEFKDKFLS